MKESIAPELLSGFSRNFALLFLSFGILLNIILLIFMSIYLNLLTRVPIDPLLLYNISEFKIVYVVLLGVHSPEAHHRCSESS
jgi:hypothetical protein